MANHCEGRNSNDYKKENVASLRKQGLCTLFMFVESDHLLGYFMTLFTLIYNSYYDDIKYKSTK